jgi:hypothetical protein
VRRKLTIRALILTGVSVIAAGCGSATHPHPGRPAKGARHTSHDARPVTAQAREVVGRQKRTVGYCLQHAGLLDVTETAVDRWQGSLPDRRPTEVDSVFVLGPYSSREAVRRAVPTIGSADVAADGGWYLVVGAATKQLAAPIAMASACLRALPGPRQAKGSKSYAF